MTLYFAYGSNISIEQMKRRCPKAVSVGVYVLGDSQLVFRGVADCAFKKDSECHGVVWKLTPECEQTLDGFEGVASGTYRKEYAPLTEPYEGENELMFYVMNSDGIYPPTQEYLDRIINGYREFDLPLNELRDAVRHSWKEKNPSWRERMRSMRGGYQKLGLSHTVKAEHKSTLPVLYDDSKKRHVDGVAPKKKAQDKQPDFFDWDTHGIVYGD